MLEPVPPPGSPCAARPWLAHYPAGVPADVLVPHVELPRLLDDAASSFPTRSALTWAGTSLSYRELRDVADHLAAGLAGLGVRKGDRVAVVLPDCPQHVLTLFAVLRLGAVVVPCDPQAPAAELEERLLSSGARVAVCLDQVAAALVRVRTAGALQHLVVTSLVDYLPVLARLRLRLPTRGARRARKDLAPPLPDDVDVVPFVRLVKSPRAARQTSVDPERDVALVHAVRGVDGRLVSARPTHGQLVSTAYLCRAWDVDARPGEDVVVSAVPLHSPRGLAACLEAVLLGATTVLLRRARAEDVVEAARRHRATVLVAPPPVLAQLARTGARDLPPLRLCVAEGGDLPVEVHRRLEQLCRAPVQVRSGVTGEGPSTHRGLAPQRPGELGLPLPSTACKIVEAHDDHREVPVGEPGELLLKGPHVVPGWHGSGEVDGYLRTGERAVMDHEGCFVLVDAVPDEHGPDAHGRQQPPGQPPRKSTPPSRRSA